MNPSALARGEQGSHALSATISSGVMISALLVRLCWYG